MVPTRVFRIMEKRPCGRFVQRKAASLRGQSPLGVGVSWAGWKEVPQATSGAQLKPSPEGVAPWVPHCGSGSSPPGI